MLEDFECPACAARDWEPISADVLTRKDRVRRAGPAMQEYIALRRRVLFEVWAPDRDEIHLTTVMCRACGFLTYRPRPTTAEIDAKYRMLQREERHIGSHHGDRRLTALNRRRTQRVCNTVTRHAGEGPLDVLDFGGGDGKMLVPFLEAGHRCALIDYNVEPIEGIHKLGDTLDDLPADARFDVIICSHVIEHLADPAAHVARFRDLLREGGIVYGEVPLGIWRGIGIADDPVTHINFFTSYSFGRLFERLGLGVASLRRMVGHYSKRLDVIGAISIKGGAGEPLANDGVAEARSLLSPTLAMDLARRIRLRRYPTARGVVRRLVRRLH